MARERRRKNVKKKIDNRGDIGDPFLTYLVPLERSQRNNFNYFLENH